MPINQSYTVAFSRDTYHQYIYQYIYLATGVPDNLLEQQNSV